MKMNINGFETNTLNASVSVVENDDSKVYIIRNETGEGIISTYEVLEDISLIFSDFHMNGVVSEDRRDIDCLAIDYCYEGRLECSLDEGVFVYQKPGDLSVDSRVKNADGYFFPLNHYHSLSITFFLPKAQESIEKCFPSFPVDLKKLRDKFLNHSYPCFIQNYSELNSIFESLRDVRMKNKSTYMTMKILELLLVLDSVEADELLRV